MEDKLDVCVHRKSNVARYKYLTIFNNNNNNNNNIYLTAIGLSPGGSGYLRVYKYKKLIINKFTFKAGGLHEKHVVATWNLGNHLSVRL
jgi:hypothetical protein